MHIMGLGNSPEDVVIVGAVRSNSNAPKENWPAKPVTTANETPEVREKPYWVYSGGKFYLKIPALKKNSVGIDWDDQKSNEKPV